MNIDLHVHTAERSGCGRSPGADQVAAARAAGLDAIVLTDHRRLAPPEALADWNRSEAPFRVLGGIELTVDGEDLLVIGVDDPRLETEDWAYPALHALVRERDGFLALAHPFRYRDTIGLDLEACPVDALEVFSNNTPPEAAGRILALARRLGLPALCNSDAHTWEAFGRYCNRLDRAADDLRDLFALLRTGRFTGVALQPDGTCLEVRGGVARVAVSA